jgi:hypothetical protein
MQNETKASVYQGLPVFYANAAGISISLSEIRVYLADAAPVSVDFSPASPERKPLAVATTPFACLIFNPEFARSVRDSLAQAIEKYEEAFGKLRPAPPQTP